MQLLPLHKVKIPMGETIAYREAGKRGERPTLVLIHGNLASSAYFHKLMNILQLKYHVIALDLPGMGDSSYNHEYLRAKEYAQCVQEFLEALGIEHYSIIGWSFGGAVAYELVLMEPERVESLILLSSLPPSGYTFISLTHDHNNIFLYPKRMYTKEDFEEDDLLTEFIEGALKKQDRKIAKAGIEDYLLHNTPETDEEKEIYIDATLKQRNLIDVYVAMTNFNISNEDNGRNKGGRRLNEIDCPILLLHGNDDHILPLLNHISARRELPADLTESHVIQNGSHALFLDRPAKVYGLIDNFLENNLPNNK